MPAPVRGQIVHGRQRGLHFLAARRAGERPQVKLLNLLPAITRMLIQQAAREIARMAARGVAVHHLQGLRGDSRLRPLGAVRGQLRHIKDVEHGHRRLAALQHIHCSTTALFRAFGDELATVGLIHFVGWTEGPRVEPSRDPQDRVVKRLGVHAA